MPSLPETFTTIKPGESGTVPLRPRPDADSEEAPAIVAAIQAVDWANLSHAYGPASDVEAQLIAVAVGDDATRSAAWWDLWGNIHHQGTIYEATVPAVPIIGRLAAWRAFPDRVEAMAMLREVAADEEVQTDARDVARGLLERWEEEPAEIRRALLGLLSALPELHDERSDLIERELPDRFGRAWGVVLRGPASQEEFDELDAFERWSMSSEP
jgi:hypothetical protein